MRAIDWTKGAQRDLDSLTDYIGADNPHAAQRVSDRIRASAESLAFMPAARAGRMAGTFEKPVRGLPYIIAFELPDEQTLRILRIIHMARDWPEGGWPED